MTTQLWFLAPVGGILFAFGIVAGRWSITVDHQGLTCTTRFGLGRFNAPVDPSSTADLTRISGFSKFLGGGLRIGSAKSIGPIFHHGEALRIQHPDGQNLTVTLTDATTAASLFNTQTARNQKTA